MDTAVPTFRELWDSTWDTFRARAWTIVLLTLMIQLPIDLLTELASHSGTNEFSSSSSQFQLQSTLSLFIGVLWSMGLIALTAEPAAGHGPGALLRIASARYMKGVAASMLYNIAVVVGLILLVVPGLVMALRYVFFLQYVVLKQSRIKHALSSSADLVRGRALDVFRRLGLCWLLVFLAAIATGLVNAGLGEGFMATLITSMPLNLVLGFAMIFSTHLFLRLEGSQDRAEIVAAFE